MRENQEVKKELGMYKGLYKENTDEIQNLNKKINRLKSRI